MHALLKFFSVFSFLFWTEIFPEHAPPNTLQGILFIRDNEEIICEAHTLEDIDTVALWHSLQGPVCSCLSVSGGLLGEEDKTIVLLLLMFPVWKMRNLASKEVGEAASTYPFLIAVGISVVYFAELVFIKPPTSFNLHLPYNLPIPDFSPRIALLFMKS